MKETLPEEPLWRPSRSLIENSNLKKYTDWLFVKKGLYFRNYDELWQWSVTDTEDFWESIWHFFSIKKNDNYSEVLSMTGKDFIGAEWFSRSTLNYAEHVFRHKNKKRPAILFQSEQQALKPVSWDTLEREVAAIAAWLRKVGIRPGDRVVGVLPNIPQTIAAFLAANAVGAIWSCCSPDFGNLAIIDRFKQIEPKVLFGVDGYVYNGREFSRKEDLIFIKKAIPSLKYTIQIPNLGNGEGAGEHLRWEDILSTPSSGLEFEALPFSHPLWILFSSGTTGKPKAIVHSNGGCLLEHLKALSFHQDVKAGENYFWYSTTGWMMWNFAAGALLTGATLVLYDGSPSFPDINVLWKLAEKAKIQHFGAGASFYTACMKAGEALQPRQLNTLRSLGSTGSPLGPEVFSWIYQSLKKDVWLISLSGGTDVCSAFIGGNPLLPVYAGEMQCRMLGASVEAFNDSGHPVTGETGEMVVTRPMPSMPVFFWNDPGDERYRDSYFNKFPGVWTHGDWIRISADGSVVIFGRSDATLNRHGVRIGPSEIYTAVESLPQVKDSLVVYLENTDRICLFLVLNDQELLTEALQQEIRSCLRKQYSPRHVPDEIHAVPELPYTKSGKKMEAPVKRILTGIPASAAASVEAMQNPHSLAYFENFLAGASR